MASISICKTPPWFVFSHIILRLAFITVRSCTWTHFRRLRLFISMATITFFNCSCNFCSDDSISSTVCFSILSKCSLSDLRMSEISDKHFFFFLWRLEMFFLIFDFIFSKVPSMALRSLSICAMVVEDLAFSVTSRMGCHSLQWRCSSRMHITQQGSKWNEQ